LTNSIMDAKYCGIPHVVFISDACRSAPPPGLTRISGGSVFRRSVSHPSTVDKFYGCSQDKSAFEIPRERQAFFTSALLRVLKAPPHSIVEETEISRQRVLVIPSRLLKPILESDVETKAHAWTPPFDQFPDIEAPSDLKLRSEFFAVTGPPPGPATRAEFGGQPPTPAPPSADTATLVEKRAEQVFHQPGSASQPEPEALREVARKSGFDGAAAAVMATRGREGFETHTGFTIIGAAVRRVLATGPLQNSEIYPPERQSATDIKIGVVGWDARPGTAVVEFQDGGGLVLGIMPGYVGTVAMEKGAVSAVMYAPAKHSVLYDSYSFLYQDIQNRRALAAAAASVAKLHYLAKAEGAALADYVRVTKGYDPALGILAGYAYYLADDEENVRSVHRWMSQTPVTPDILAPVPFDVAMLARKLDFQTTPGIAGCCPMFSFGWSLLDRLSVEMPHRIREAGEYRRPGTWVAFDQQGIRLVQEALERGEIR